MNPKRRDFLLASAASFAAPAFLGAEDKPAEIPISGSTSPEMAVVDEAFTKLVREQKIPALGLAISKDGKLAYARTFGYADREKKTPATVDALFRIASLSKPITSVAIYQLIEKGTISLDDCILDKVRFPPLLPKGEKVDPRWAKVTVRQCLQHTLGHDRDKSEDPIIQTGDNAKLLNSNVPISTVNVLRYGLGKPLDFDPGTKQVYSNIGYLLLGQLIQIVSRQTYQDYVKKEVFAALKITQPRLGRAIVEQRAKNEVRYYDSKNRDSYGLYPPRIGKQVPIPDGGENFEAFEAHGGWIASAIDLVRFLSAFDDPAKCTILSAKSIETMWAPPPGEVGHDKNGKPLPNYYASGWTVQKQDPKTPPNCWHIGRMSGTSAYMARYFNNICWAALFSTDTTDDVKEPALYAEKLMIQALGKIKDWPKEDLFPKYLK